MGKPKRTPAKAKPKKPPRKVTAKKPLADSKQPESAAPEQPAAEPAPNDAAHLHCWVKYVDLGPLTTTETESPPAAPSVEQPSPGMPPIARPESRPESQPEWLETESDNKSAYILGLSKAAWAVLVCIVLAVIIFLLALLVLAQGTAIAMADDVLPAGSVTVQTPRVDIGVGWCIPHWNPAPRPYWHRAPRHHPSRPYYWHQLPKRMPSR